MNFDNNKILNSISTWFKKKFGRSLSQDAIEGLSELLEYIQSDNSWKDYRHVGNFLAQVGHESAWTFQPIKERRGKPGTKIRAIQDKYWYTSYYGRGHIMLTHKSNYLKFEKILGIPLTSKPDLALDFETSYKIAAIGMLRGLFTGVKLSDFFNASKEDHYNARKIVNRLDRAADIAEYSKAICGILKQSLLQENFKEIAASEEQDAIEYQDNNEVSSDIDAYPEDPKPGEAIEGSPADAEAPVVGGRPTDEPVIISPPVTEKPTGWSTWKATLTGIFSTLGISAASAGSWFSGLVKNPTALNILVIVGIGTLLLGFIFGIIYLILRSINISRREKMAHEITLEELRIRANPALYNVKVSSTPKVTTERERN